MLDISSYDEFAKQVGTKFNITDLPVIVEIELIEITEREKTARQECFSLIFRGPSESVLPQSIYTLQHEQLGIGGLFLVAAGVTEQGVEYQATFNRLLETAA